MLRSVNMHSSESLPLVSSTTTDCPSFDPSTDEAALSSRLPMKCCHRCDRRPELPYRTRWSFVAETRNTVSNVAFLISAVLCGSVLGYLQQTEPAPSTDRPVSTTVLWTLIVFFFFAGICSAVHHACCDRWGHRTIFLDWLFILCSIILLSVTIHFMNDVQRLQLWSDTSTHSVVLLGVAVAILAEDHVSKRLPVRWGHSMWHRMAALAILSTYLDWIFALFPSVLPLWYVFTSVGIILTALTEFLLY